MSKKSTIAASPAAQDEAYIARRADNFVGLVAGLVNFGLGLDIHDSALSLWPASFGDVSGWDRNGTRPIRRVDGENCLKTWCPMCPSSTRGCGGTLTLASCKVTDGRLTWSVDAAASCNTCHRTLDAATGAEIERAIERATGFVQGFADLLDRYRVKDRRAARRAARRSAA